MLINAAGAELSYAAAWRRVAMPALARRTAEAAGTGAVAVSVADLDPNSDNQRNDARARRLDSFLQEIGQK